MGVGRWDYKQYTVEDLLKEIAHDREIKKRFPKLAKLYLDLSTLLADNIHQLDWDLSGDSTIKNDKNLEKDFIEKLREITENK